MNLWKARHRLFDAIFKRGPAKETTKVEETPQCKETLLPYTGSRARPRPNTIVLDVDDTVLQWWNGFINAPANKSFHDNACTPNCGKPRSEWDKAITKFNSSEEFAHLSPVYKAPEFVKWLVGQGYRVVFLSACGVSEDVYRMRQRNLCSALELYESEYDLVTLPVGSSKVDAMKNLLKTHNVRLFIDDMREHCNMIRSECNIPSVYFCGNNYAGGVWVDAFHIGVDVNKDIDTIKEEVSGIVRGMHSTDWAPSYLYVSTIMRELGLRLT